MTNKLEYRVTLELDQEMFDVLGTISRNQEGFVWDDVEVLNDNICPNCAQHVD